MSIFPGPQPPYTNPIINPQYYEPSIFFISAITLGSTTIVTTTEDTNYVVGQIVRLLIPSQFGTRELDEVEGIVMSFPADNEIQLTINSQGFTPFIANPTFYASVPQVVAVGDINSGQINSNPLNCITYIPGSFIDISP